LFDAYSVLTGINTAQNRVTNAIQFAEQALTVARDLGSDRMASRALHLLAIVSAGRDRERAQDMFWQAVRKLEAYGPVAFAANARSNLGVNSWFLGENDLALTALETACAQRSTVYGETFLTLARHRLSPAPHRVHVALDRLASSGRPVLAELLEMLVLPQESHRSVEEVLEPFGGRELRADLATTVERIRTSTTSLRPE
jgi:hypothetical protein